MTEELKTYETNHMEAMNSHTSLHCLNFEAADVDEAIELARDWWALDYGEEVYDWYIEAQAK